MSSPVRSSCKRSSTANSRRSTEASTYTSAISEESWERTPTEPNAFAVFGMWATSTRCLRRRVPPLVRRQVSALAQLKAKNDAVNCKDESKNQDNLDETCTQVRPGFLVPLAVRLELPLQKTGQHMVLVDADQKNRIGVDDKDIKCERLRGIGGFANRKGVFPGSVAGQIQCPGEGKVRA